MSKPVAELLQPRILVLDKYPHSPFKKGDILVQANPIHAPSIWMPQDGKDRTALVSNPEECPNLFKPLKWWQLRPIEDLPQYLFQKGFGHYYRATWTYPDLQLDKVKATHAGNNTAVRMSLHSFDPATLEDYETYQNLHG